MDETGSWVLRNLGCGNQPGWWRVDFAATICRTRWGCFSCIEGDGDGFVSGFVLQAIKIARASNYHSRRDAGFCRDPSAVFFINLIQCRCTSPPPFSAPHWGWFSSIESNGDGFVSGFVLQVIKIAHTSNYHSRRDADFYQDPGAVFLIHIIQCWCVRCALNLFVGVLSMA